MTQSNLKDKYKGCLVGAAIGDALGMPMEDVTRKRAEEYYPDGIIDFTQPNINTPCGHLESGQHTDDTQLMVALCEILTEKGQFDPDSFVAKLLEWDDKRDERRYCGEATKTAIRNLRSGKSWTESGVNKTGCGGATRAIPIGLLYFRDVKKAIDVAIHQCSITHQNQIAKDGAACVAYIISSLANNILISIDDLKTIVQSPELRIKLNEVEVMLKRKDSNDDDAIAIIGNSSLTPEVVGLSLYFFLSNPFDFQNPVLRAANATGERGGDTDSIAFLVGSFSGAYNGLDKIQKSWVDKVENSNYLQGLAESLYSISANLEK